ncbi:uncharacterized protein LOC131680876 [Topomyia yanbarensis]|uniref:uncharacterized protein LOC131680876 n=1 Tax=Topomyia yanbarensis TaxID=2498891 RepID=UPI00273BD521|nr:uncharacterized protein LOC131680876 [Topomyia yanbarensis]
MAIIMDKCCVLLVLLLSASIVQSQTSTQVQNRQIWHSFCSAATRGNVFASYQAFNPICSTYSPEACCDVVAQAIRTYPDMQLCRTTSGFQFGPVGCGVDRSSTDTIKDEPEPSNFHFPAEPPKPVVPVRRTGPMQTTGAIPTKSVDIVEIVFNYNPHDNVRVSIPVPKTSTIPASGGSSQRPKPVDKTQNSRPTAQQLGQQSQSLPSDERPNPNDESDYQEEEMPVVMVNTPGYQAMEFALNLFKNIDRPRNGDSVISPLLPQLLLSNLIDVANPVTQRQLLNAIRLYPEQLDKLTKSLQDVSKSTVNTVEFASVNFVARDLRLNKTYSEDVRLRNVEVLSVDFSQPSQAARTANKWVSDKTHHLINEIISPGSLSANTRLLLANSIYFKGKWKYAFVQTEPAKFESAPGSSQPVNSMYQLNKLRSGELNFPDDNGLRWVELPYEGDKLAMLVFLPTQRHQLEASFRQLRPEDLAKVMAQLDISYINTKVHLNLPKFTLSDSVSLNGPLERLGLISIFSNGDALKYLSNEATLVSDVTQRTYLSVDEQGTKATSVASLSIVPLSITPQYREIRFKVDQPFLVMIVDKRERYPVFIGQIYDPQESYLALALAQSNRNRRPNSPQRLPPGGAQVVNNEFVDERNCQTGQAPGTPPDQWECLCNQVQYERAECEQQIEKLLQANPNIKLCTDQPHYYLGTNQKCHYEADWESSNNPAGKAMQFALDLFRTADPKNPTENFVISPLSPQVLLAQLTDGCSEPARIEMIKALQLNSREVNSLVDALVYAANKASAANKLDIASIFFKSVYVNLTEKFNMARKENRIRMRDLDFSNTKQAAQEMNEWVNQMTRGNIPEAVTERNLSPDTALMLLNAIYFKGTWQYKFNESDTNKRGTFEVQRGQKMSVHMMSQSNHLRFGEINFGQYSDPNWGLRWVELPYDGDELSMILLLPKARHQLDESLKQVTGRHLQDIFQTIRRDHNPITIHMQVPKFTIRDSISLVEPLMKLGVKRIFEDDRALSGLSTTPTKVADVKQEAFLSVDEQGTTATAVTKVTIIPLSLSSYNDIDFVCDEPFMAMIVDKTREIPLFMAKIRQPLKTKPKRES